MITSYMVCDSPTMPGMVYTFRGGTVIILLSYVTCFAQVARSAPCVQVNMVSCTTHVHPYTVISILCLNSNVCIFRAGNSYQNLTLIWYSILRFTVPLLRIDYSYYWQGTQLNKNRKLVQAQCVCQAPGLRILEIQQCLQLFKCTTTRV